MVLAQFGGVPAQPFVTTEQPVAPDYTHESAWAALPHTDDAADVAPHGVAIPEAQNDAPADVFYIHPTTYRSGENWNQDISMADVNAWTDISVIARQASAFNGCCKIYAPRYRQATIAALASLESGPKAYDLAYADVKRAWHHYLEHWNKGRPFIIVSHSQGTLHAVRLLEEVIDKTALVDQMIAAYAIGIGIPEGLFGKTLRTITRCKTATDTRCVISWNTYGAGGDAARMVERTQERYRLEQGTSEGQTLTCWNPVGTYEEQKQSEDPRLWALAGVASAGPLPPLKPGPSAECQNGILYIDIPSDEAFQLMILEGKNLHMHDFDLFYGRIRANAVARTEAYFQK